jgi:hypothetical protein
MITWLKGIFQNISNFIAGITFTVGLSAVFLIAGTVGSLMCLVGMSESNTYEHIQRGLIYTS